MKEFPNNCLTFLSENNRYSVPKYTPNKVIQIEPQYFKFSIPIRLKMERTRLKFRIHHFCWIISYQYITFTIYPGIQVQKCYSNKLIHYNYEIQPIRQNRRSRI